MANIGKSIVFKGDLTGDEDIEIEGKINGRIDLPKNQLTIGSHGRVQAEVTAKSVIVVGHLTGNIHATERVEIQASGVVQGDIHAPRLLVQEGAVVNGAIEMSGSQPSEAHRSSAAPAKIATTGNGAGPGTGRPAAAGAEVRRTG